MKLLTEKDLRSENPAEKAGVRFNSVAGHHVFSNFQEFHKLSHQSVDRVFGGLSG